MKTMILFNALPIEDQIHCYRVAATSKLLAEIMGLSSPEVDTIEHSALYHDIGKAMVPQALHRKPGVLSERERAIVLSHTTVGKRILGCRESLLSTAPIVAFQHHEYLDGSGYFGMTDKAIHPHAKLVTVADVFDKLVFCQPGKKKVKVEKANAILTQSASSKLDTQAVRILLANVDQIVELCHETNINAFSMVNTHC